MKKTNDKALKKLLNLQEKDYLLKYDKLRASDELKFDETDSTEDKEKQDKSADENQDKTADENQDKTSEEGQDAEHKEGQDKTSEEGQDAENSEEQDASEDETQDEEDKDSDETGKKGEGGKPSKAGKSTAPIVDVQLAAIYSKMQQAKTPADVGLALQEFLKNLQKATIEGLVKIETGEPAKAESEKE